MFFTFLALHFITGYFKATYFCSLLSLVGSRTKNLFILEFSLFCLVNFIAFLPFTTAIYFFVDAVPTITNCHYPSH
jgi:hypothetical protein